MNLEIERKFLVEPRSWNGKPVRSVVLEQGYLADTGTWETRLRRSETEHRLTMKSGLGRDRGEWEIKLSPQDFEALWPETEGLRISKTRDRYEWKGLAIEVDRYAGTLDGLTVAEVEFPGLSAARNFLIPKGFGPELTYDPRFKNRALAAEPSVPRRPPGKDTTGWSFGAVPYRKGPRGWEMVIITTRRQDRWIFPKGQPEPGLTPDKVALAEAKEEAGVMGKVTGHPVILPYVRENGTANLLLYPVLVSSLADRWLELGQRDRKVISLDEADSHGEVVRLGALWLRDLLDR